jgi:hypothetical protein
MDNGVQQGDAIRSEPPIPGVRRTTTDSLGQYAFTP